MSSRRLPGNAVAWMALQAAAVFAASSLSPGFGPIGRIDSKLYLQLARHASIPELLASIRTLGYPLWLRLVGAFSPDLSWLPHLQLLVYCLAVVGLCAALRRFGLSEGAAFAAASPPLYSPLVPHLAPSVMSDVPAASFALATVSLLLVVVAEPGRRLAWAGLGAALFLTYQLRPSHLFLVWLVPLAGWALPWLEAGWRSPHQPARRGGRRLAGLATLALLPLAVFCTARFLVVGHFGLVAFTGHNLSGLTTAMLTPELIAELPDGERALAAKILAEREAKGHPAVGLGSRFDEWRAPFISHAWRTAVPVARLLWEEEEGREAGPSQEQERSLWVDRRLISLSLAVLRERPGLYASWLARAWGFCLAKTAANPWVWATAAAAGGAALLAWRRRRRFAAGPRPFPHALVRSLGFLLLAVAYYLLAVGLLLLLQPPEWRYLAAAELLLPGALAAAAVEAWHLASVPQASSGSQAKARSSGASG